MTVEEKLSLAEELTRQANDYHAVYNVISGMMYLLQVQKHQEIMDTLWSAREDISFGAAKGRAAVLAFFLEESGSRKQQKLAAANRVYGTELCEENLGVGDLETRLAANPYIVIAADGQTAKGVWFSPAVKAEIDENGVLSGRYMQEQIAVDFIRENGAFKIWHYNVYPDFTAPLPDYTFDDSRYQGRTFEMDGSPNEEHTNFKEGEEPEGGRPVPYGAQTIPCFKPPIPVPYATWTADEDLPIM